MTRWNVGSFFHEIFQARIWNGLPFPFPEDQPNPGIKPASLLTSSALQADSLAREPLGKLSDSRLSRLLIRYKMGLKNFKDYIMFFGLMTEVTLSSFLLHRQKCGIHLCFKLYHLLLLFASFYII